jgi:ApaG protein
MKMDDARYAIRVTAHTVYVAEQSDPDAERFVFAYTITIENSGSITAQLLNRHWIITDAAGKVQEVKGEGVVGKQPVLPPGGAFRYTSAAMIETPVGCMNGSYEMLADDGVRFDAEIPAFNLAMPNLLH